MEVPSPQHVCECDMRYIFQCLFMLCSIITGFACIRNAKKPTLSSVSNHVKHVEIGFIFLRKVMTVAYTTIYHCLIDLAGLRPSNPPHKGAYVPFWNPWKALRGRESAVKGMNYFMLCSSRVHGWSSLIFSPCYILWITSALRKPNLQKWAKL